MKDLTQCISDEEYCEEIPECFICPLTLEAMDDPLMDRRGMNFERKAIVEWLNRGNKTCPLTREPLSYSNLVPNAALRMRIERWKKDNGMKVDSTYVNHKKKNTQFLCMIDAPPNSMLNERWATQVVASTITVDDDWQARSGRRSRLVRADDPIFSAGAQRRSLSAILDSALAAVRRNPGVENRE
jgi:hypothetical protein